jgi:alkylation response protein AidB-like acyl-CoA dehydrogenase
MFDHLTNPVLMETRVAIQRFIDEELRPLERELDLGAEDPWPREVLRNVWRRSSELGLYAACLPVELGGKGLNIAEQCALKADLAASGRCWRRTCWAISAGRRAWATCSSTRRPTRSNATSSRSFAERSPRASR